MSHDDQERDDDPTVPPRRPPGPGTADWEAAERENLARRPFDLATAVGRAGAGNLKGASPVPASQQLLLDIGALLACRLADGDGSLTRTLLARLADDPPLLARHAGRPDGALAELLDRALATPAALAELVRETDARWGRDFSERPLFEPGDRPPADDDPYTLDGVNARLVNLRQGL